MKSFVLRSHWPAECAAPYGDPAPHTSPPSIEPSVLEYSLAFEPPTQQQPSVSITRRSGLIALHVEGNIRSSTVRGGGCIFGCALGDVVEEIRVPMHCH